MAFLFACFLTVTAFWAHWLGWKELLHSPLGPAGWSRQVSFQPLQILFSKGRNLDMGILSGLQGSVVALRQLLWLLAEKPSLRISLINSLHDRSVKVNKIVPG